MGVNSSCSNCCIEKDFNLSGRPNTTITGGNDGSNPDDMELVVVLPKPTYAKPVNSIIDMTNIVKKTYKE